VEPDQFFVNDLSSQGHLLERLEGWREYCKLVNERGPARPQFVTPLRSRAAAMITSPYDPWLFQMNRILHIGLAEAVQNRIELLHTDAPAIDEYLDDRTLDWWTKRKIRGGSLTVMIVVAIVMVFFVVNNFKELPGVFVALLSSAAVVLGYAILKKWPAMQVLSRPRQLESYTLPVIRILAFPVAASFIYIFNALPFNISVLLIAGVFVIWILVFRKRR
jgi:hypothetical protein